MTVLLSSLGSLCRVLLRQSFGQFQVRCLASTGRPVCTIRKGGLNEKKIIRWVHEAGCALSTASITNSLPIPSQPFSRLCTFEPSAAYTLAYTVSALYCMTNSIHSCLRKRKLQMHVRLGSLSEFA